MPILAAHILCDADVTALFADTDPCFDLICFGVAGVTGTCSPRFVTDAGNLSVNVIAGLPHG